MTGESIRIEQLESGINAAFINMPHFRTHAARLVVYAGAMHEEPEAQGSAHFLEHITFQGTEEFPTQKEQSNYITENELSVNAFTGKNITNYIADGYELGAVGKFVTQTALFPIMSDEALERERGPIVDEIRGYESSPYWNINAAHNRASWGSLYSKSIAGTVEDVLELSPESLRSFHDRNYRLGNMVLILCSADPVQKQREFANQLIHSLPAAQETGCEVGFDRFNPTNKLSSLQQVDLDDTAQTYIELKYETPSQLSIPEQWEYGVLGKILGKNANDKLRTEMALCYGASGGDWSISNLRFGENKRWSSLSVSANIGGENATKGLEALLSEVVRKPIEEKEFEIARRAYIRQTEHILESNPSAVATMAQRILSDSRVEEIRLDEPVTFAKNLKFENIQKLQDQLVEAKPLVVSTSPNEKTLEAIGDWAHKKFNN